MREIGWLDVCTAAASTRTSRTMLLSIARQAAIATAQHVIISSIFEIRSISIKKAESDGRLKNWKREGEKKVMGIPQQRLLFSNVFFLTNIRQLTHFVQSFNTSTPESDDVRGISQPVCFGGSTLLTSASSAPSAFAQQQQKTTSQNPSITKNHFIPYLLLDINVCFQTTFMFLEIIA